MKVRCTMSLLLLTTLAATDTFLSGYKKKGIDNEACSSKNNEASSSEKRRVKLLYVIFSVLDIGELEIGKP
jgi:hypothetical protein